MPSPVLRLAWRDLRASGRGLWVFCACLALGVALVAAAGGLFHQVRAGLVADTRELFGGDLEVRQREPLAPAELAWIREHGDVSLLIELRTMLRTLDGRTQLVELQSVDQTYPLYGAVELQPSSDLASVVASRDGRWGAAFDPLLAERLALEVGDRVLIGDLEVALRAAISRQPDRSLRASWRGPPLIVAAPALRASGLIQPGSRLAYRYRVRTDRDPERWRAEFAAAFPASESEIRTFAERSRRIDEVLRQLASGLLLIAFSALFIGGLGVFNSVHAYLQSKLLTMATLRAVGLRERALASIYLAQVLLIAGGSSLVGVLVGGALALLGAAVAAERLPLGPTLEALLAPLALAWAFGLLTALTFALPALGRAISVTPAALLRGVVTGDDARVSGRYRVMTVASAALVGALALITVPEPSFGGGFVVAVAVLLALLETLVRIVRAGARRLSIQPWLPGRFGLRLALANLHRPSTALRPTLLSLGTALALIAASTLVVVALMRTLEETLPERLPALVFYDVSAYQTDALRDQVQTAPSLERLELAPLVLGRLERVNGQSLSDSSVTSRMLEARDEHKLSNRHGDLDRVIVTRGAWWPRDYTGPPLVAFEDREADQLGLKVGDQLRFRIMGEAVDVRLAAIYAQRRYQARLWLEGIFSDGVLDPFITRYVGAAFVDPADAASIERRVASTMPNVVTVRTTRILGEARAVLARAASGLALVASVSLAASLLVLVSVLAATRIRMVYDAAVLHALGARLSTIRHALVLEFALYAALTSVFGFLLGGVLAQLLLEHRLQLPIDGVRWAGAASAVLASVFSLALGARSMLRELRLQPAMLLRAGG